MTSLLDPKPRVGELFVLETYDGHAYLGELAFETGYVTVRTGYVGRPPVIAMDDVAEIVPAALHADVVMTQLLAQR